MAKPFSVSLIWPIAFHTHHKWVFPCSAIYPPAHSCVTPVATYNLLGQQNVNHPKRLKAEPSQSQSLNF